MKINFKNQITIFGLKLIIALVYYRKISKN